MCVFKIASFRCKVGACFMLPRAPWCRCGVSCCSWTGLQIACDCVDVSVTGWRQNSRAHKPTSASSYQAVTLLHHSSFLLWPFMYNLFSALKPKLRFLLCFLLRWFIYYFLVFQPHRFCQLNHLLIFFRELKGVVVSLSSDGHLFCSYMGTDPSFFTTPKVDAREADYEQVEAEMKKLQRCIRELTRTQGRTLLFKAPTVHSGPRLSRVTLSLHAFCAYRTDVNWWNMDICGKS